MVPRLTASSSNNFTVTSLHDEYTLLYMYHVATLEGIHSLSVFSSDCVGSLIMCLEGRIVAGMTHRCMITAAASVL